MNTQKFTKKSLEAIQSAQSLTVEYQNMQVEQVHLLAALLGQEDGLIPQLLQKMQVDVVQMETMVDQEISKISRVSGPGREPDKIYISQDVDKALNRSEKLADNMKDEYVSVEHIFLALITEADHTLREISAGFHHKGYVPASARQCAGEYPRDQ